MFTESNNTNSAKSINENSQLIFNGKKLIVNKMIGEGASAFVYEGEYDGHAVVIKALNPNMRGNPIFIEEFKKEGDRLAYLWKQWRLDYPDQPPVTPEYFGINPPELSTFIVEEFVDGKNFVEALGSRRSGNFSEEQSLHIARQMGRVIALVHAKRECYGDVKLDNFRIVDGFETSTPKIKVIDWNALNILTDETRRKDLFYISCYLELLLTGENLSPNERTLQVEKRPKDTGEYKNLTVGVQEFLNRTTHHDFEKRYQTIEEWLARVEELHSYWHYDLATFTKACSNLHVNALENNKLTDYSKLREMSAVLMRRDESSRGKDFYEKAHRELEHIDLGAQIRDSINKHDMKYASHLFDDALKINFESLSEETILLGWLAKAAKEDENIIWDFREDLFKGIEERLNGKYEAAIVLYKKPKSSLQELTDLINESEAMQLASDDNGNADNLQSALRLWKIVPSKLREAGLNRQNILGRLKIIDGHMSIVEKVKRLQGEINNQNFQEANIALIEAWNEAGTDPAIKIEVGVALDGKITNLIENKEFDNAAILFRQFERRGVESQYSFKILAELISLKMAVSDENIGKIIDAADVFRDEDNSVKDVYLEFASAISEKAIHRHAWNTAEALIEAMTKLDSQKASTYREKLNVAQKKINDDIKSIKLNIESKCIEITNQNVETEQFEILQALCQQLPENDPDKVRLEGLVESKKKDFIEYIKINKKELEMQLSRRSELQNQIAEKQKEVEILLKAAELCGDDNARQILNKRITERLTDIQMLQLILKKHGGNVNEIFIVDRYYDYWQEIKQIAESRMDELVSMENDVKLIMASHNQDTVIRKSGFKEVSEYIWKIEPYSKISTAVVNHIKTATYQGNSATDESSDELEVVRNYFESEFKHALNSREEGNLEELIQMRQVLNWLYGRKFYGKSRISNDKRKKLEQSIKKIFIRKNKQTRFGRKNELTQIDEKKLLTIIDQLPVPWYEEEISHYGKVNYEQTKQARPQNPYSIYLWSIGVVFIMVVLAGGWYLAVQNDLPGNIFKPRLTQAIDSPALPPIMEMTEVPPTEVPTAVLEPTLLPTIEPTIIPSSEFIISGDLDPAAPEGVNPLYLLDDNSTTAFVASPEGAWLSQPAGGINGFVYIGSGANSKQASATWTMDVPVAQTGSYEFFILDPLQNSGMDKSITYQVLVNGSPAPMISGSNSIKLMISSEQEAKDVWQSIGVYALTAGQLPVVILDLSTVDISGIYMVGADAILIALTSEPEVCDVSKQPLKQLVDLQNEIIACADDKQVVRMPVEEEKWQLIDSRDFLYNGSGWKIEVSKDSPIEVVWTFDQDIPEGMYEVQLYLPVEMTTDAKVEVLVDDISQGKVDILAAKTGAFFNVPIKIEGGSRGIVTVKMWSNIQEDQGMQEPVYFAYDMVAITK